MSNSTNAVSRSTVQPKFIVPKHSSDTEIPVRPSFRSFIGVHAASAACGASRLIEDAGIATKKLPEPGANRSNRASRPERVYCSWNTLRKSRRRFPSQGMPEGGQSRLCPSCVFGGLRERKAVQKGNFFRPSRLRRLLPFRIDKGHDMAKLAI